MGNSKKVLFISSYTESYDSVPLQIQGIKEVLYAHDIQLDLEYMDTKRINTEENIELFHTLLQYKLNHIDSYDAVIVGDDNALQFAIDNHEELFSELPIVFVGINDISRALEAGRHSQISGIYQETSLKENIELALKFNPKATQIVAVVDNTYTGVGDQSQLLMAQPDFPNKNFIMINASDYTFDEVAEKIEALGNESILLYLSMYTDKEGNYMTVSEAVEFFRIHANIPVYRSTVGGVGEGLLGGKMVSFEESGKMAAQMVVDVLNGASIEDIGVITKSPNYYVLDYQILKKYNIDMDLVPADAIIINKKISFYEQNKQLVWVVISIISSLTVFSFILVLDNLKRRVIEKALKESHDKLSQTYEELSATEEELREQYTRTQENSDKLKLLNEKYELSISSTNSAVWEINLTTGEIYFSDNIDDILNLPIMQNESIRSIFKKVLTGPTKAQLLDAYIKYRKGISNELSLQLPITTSNHITKWVMVQGKGATNVAGALKMLHGILLDVTKMKEQELYIEHLAHHDYLTDLPNRLCFMDKLRDELALDLPLSIIMIDIDNFKSINDTLGHAYGDILLKDIAIRLNTLSCDKLFISRFGGDEFLLMISDNADQKNIKRCLQKIQALFKKPILIGQREHYLEFSMGISRYPMDSDNLHQLIMNADTAMYQVKHNGKNNFLFYNKGMQDSIKERAGIETILHKAMKEDGFYLVYQPRVSVIDGEIEGFEALLRLKHHKIPPNIFIKIAEESDLILEIGRRVTKDAIAQIAQWRDKGFPPKILSINFSSRQIKDSGYIKFLQSTLEEYSVDPKILEIEITESILLDETDDTIEFLYSLRELGVRIALDDFGTGYSSIRYLTYIPVDHVKLDKSLSDKFLQLGNMKVMNSIISLAHSLNLSITAEGIEEQKQYECLKESGCDYIQGYYFSKPLEIELADEIYSKNLLLVR